MKKALFSFISLIACICCITKVHAENINVNGNTSKNLNEIIKNANNGDTIVLTQNIEINAEDEFINVSASQKNITLDFNGHEIKSSNDKNATIVVDGDTKVTITGNGTVKHTNNQPALIVKNGDVIIENGTFAVDTAPYYAIHVGDNSDKDKDNLSNTLVIKNAKVTNSKSGGIIVLTKHSKLDIDNIDLVCHDNTAVSTHSKTTDVEINIKGGNFVSLSSNDEKQSDGIGILGSNITLNISGGTIKAPNGVGINSNNSSGNISNINISGGYISAHVGIYQPQKANLNITNGTIEGSIGIVARQGLVNISGGIIKGIADDSEEEFAVGYKDHKLKPGTAMVVDNAPTTYGKDLVANISGGEFQGSSENAIYSYEKNDSDYVITGGKYNKPFNANFIQNSKAEIKIGDNYYVGKEAEEAIKQAEDGTTVTVLQGDLDIDNINGGVIVENKGHGNVNVNGEEIENGKQITTNYKRVIKFNGEDFILEVAKGEYSQIGLAKNDKGQTLKDVMKNFNIPDDKNSVYFIDEDNNRVYYTTLTDKDMNIKSQYTVKVEIEGKTVTPKEGTLVKDVEILSDIAEDNHFYYFIDKDGNHYNLNDKLKNNVKLTVVYKVTIKVNPVDDVSIGVGYTTKYGTTLRDILESSWGRGLKAYIEAEGFLKFIDENGNIVNLDDEITQDVILTAVYKTENNNNNTDMKDDTTNLEYAISENPNTLDNVITYIVLAIISLGMIIGIIITKKNKLFNR